ncbi:limbic system-associated membrane protein isoform X2 [Lepeophtheirus salmonis]|uniref:limbic system-associated membrane protein isoform X2 n=1 Tax=Lepeophtheirus salmonis TaxID=72036 RepID=UPI001AE7AB61|nr:neurotrimin-like isoform X2 [Lepeophtheirus salmonis]
MIMMKVLCSLILFLCQPKRLLGNNSDPWSEDFRPSNIPSHVGPIFDNSYVTNVTAQQGGNAHLQCKVLNIKGDVPVSWIRRKDWHIISTGLFIYLNDARFGIQRRQGTQDWTLLIKSVQKRDEGTYVCQVSTKEGVVSHYFNLHVLVPTAFILGSDEYHTQAGNVISLVCIIENSLEPPQFVIWYHNGKLINYDTSRSKISVTTDPGQKTHSRLIISDVTKEDSGNYTCSAPNTESSSIDVFVSPGDKTMSLSDLNSGQTQGSSQSLHIIINIILLTTRIFGR